MVRLRKEMSRPPPRWGRLGEMNGQLLLGHPLPYSSTPRHFASDLRALLLAGKGKTCMGRKRTCQD